MTKKKKATLACKYREGSHYSTEDRFNAENTHIMAFYAEA